jgi:16S rRNA (cytosine967-C5)-methyltransferase
MNALPDSPLGALVLELWKSTRIDWSFATGALARTFRAHRELGGRERRLVSETLYGLIRHLRRLDEALAAGGVVSANRAPDRERLLAYLVLEAGLPADEAAAVAPAVDWSAVAAIDERLARVPDVVRRIALRHSLPDWLAARLAHDLGDAAESVVAALNQRAPMTVRVNTLRTDRDALAAALAEQSIDTEPGRYCDTALHVSTRTNLFALAPFKSGWFEAQDEGSQLIAELVAPPPRSLVVDVCAGAGGKTLALAAALGNRGRVVAADVDGRKLTELKRRARRAGATNIQSVAMERDGDVYPPALARLEGKVARVLVDAPCTGVGALRRNPEARWRLTEADCDRMPQLQREICARALSLVAPGGRLIYATCTLLRAENEAVVEAMLAGNPELELMPAKMVWGKQRADAICDSSGSFLKVEPKTHGTDGFFAAVLRKPG